MYKPQKQSQKIGDAIIEVLFGKQRWMPKTPVLMDDTDGEDPDDEDEEEVDERPPMDPPSEEEINAMADVVEPQSEREAYFIAHS